MGTGMSRCSYRQADTIFNLRPEEGANATGSAHNQPDDNHDEPTDDDTDDDGTDEEEEERIENDADFELALPPEGSDIEDQHLFRLATVDPLLEHRPFWKSPYECLEAAHPSLRFHNNMSEYLKSRAVRHRIRLDIEPDILALGPKEIPEGFQPFINRTIKLYLRKSGSIKDARLRACFMECDYLLESVQYLQLDLLATPLLREDIRILLQENHRNRRRHGVLTGLNRQMYSSHVWFVHGDLQALCVRGVEFDLFLCVRMPEHPSPHADPDEWDLVKGYYKRRLDCLGAASDIYIEWKVEFDDNQETTA